MHSRLLDETMLFRIADFDWFVRGLPFGLKAIVVIDERLDRADGWRILSNIVSLLLEYGASLLLLGKGAIPQPPTSGLRQKVRITVTRGS